MISVQAKTDGVVRLHTSAREAFIRELATAEVRRARSVGPAVGTQ